MGKIRIKTIGDEQLEKQQAEEAKKRSETKKTESEQATATLSSPKEKKGKKEKFKKKNKGVSRSKSYLSKAELVDKNKKYTLEEAIKLLPQLKRAKFDETVELHFTLTDGSMSGSVVLPHGTGKQIKVAIADGKNLQELDTLIKKIESGNIDFDVLVATPDAMPRLARVARILGPKGLMPNPKAGTVTTKPEEVAQRYQGGQINFKTEAKFPLLHIALGKVSFGEEKIKENIMAILQSIDHKKIKNATLKSTMSPAIPLDLASL
jgi:large subunit ribosomal protein L1